MKDNTQGIKEVNTHRVLRKITHNICKGTNITFERIEQFSREK